MPRKIVNTKKEEVTSVNNTAEEQVEVKPVKTSKPALKKFGNTDEIPCVSITPGELFVEGKRSDELYTFADIDDVQYLRYDDLIYLVRTHSPYVFKPRFIIQSKDFLAQHKDIDSIYSSLYSVSDLKDILKLLPDKLRVKLTSLPEGAKDSLKIIVSTMIDRGKFDSIQRIKVLDEVFGTEMLRKVAGT